MLNSPFVTVLALLVSCAGVFIYCYQTGATIDKYKKEGIKAEAKIISKDKIGASGTGNTKFKVILEFTTKDGVVRTTTKRYFTPEELIKVMRNNTVVLYYLPGDPQKVVLRPDEMD